MFEYLTCKHGYCSRLTSALFSGVGFTQAQVSKSGWQNLNERGSHHTQSCIISRLIYGGAAITHRAAVEDEGPDADVCEVVKAVATLKHERQEFDQVTVVVVNTPWSRHSLPVTTSAV